MSVWLKGSPSLTFPEDLMAAALQAKLDNAFDHGRCNCIVHSLTE